MDKPETTLNNEVLACPARFERATYALEGRDYEYFGNDFGNKGVVLPQTLVIPIDLAEAVRFELTEDFHPRQFSRLVHSTTLPRFH